MKKIFILFLLQFIITNSFAEIQVQGIFPENTHNNYQIVLFILTLILILMLFYFFDKKKANRSIRESEERFRALYEEAPVGLYRTTPDGTILMANQALIRMLGYTSFEELSSRNLANDGFESSYSREIFIAKIEKSGEVKNLEANWTRRDGNTIIVNEYAKAIRDLNGNVLYYDGTVEDITSRKQAEKRRDQQLFFKTALNEIAEVTISKENMEAILSSTNTIISRTLHADWTLIYNISFSKNRIKELCESLGVDYEGYKPRLEHDISMDMFMNAFEYIGKTKRYIESHFDHVNVLFSETGMANILHNKLNIKSLIWYPFAFDEHGYYLLTMNQILEKREWTSEEIDFLESVAKQVNLALIKIRLLEERKQSEEMLINAKERAEESDNLKRAFLNNISHEIRTPFNGILGFLSMLQFEDITVNERDEYISLINQSAFRLMNTINDIVEISQIQTGQTTITPSRFNIGRQIDELVNRFKTDADNKRLEFRIKNVLPASVEFVSTDLIKLNTILANLITNAIKFTRVGFVEFGVRLIDGYLEFSVKDTGIGIAENKLQKIFEWFIQADVSSTRGFEGSGLGLSISGAYAKMLGGRIWVESSEGVGSVFYFALPWFSEPIEEKVTDSSVTDKAENGPSKNLRILIAEDDEGSELLITIAIREFGKEIIKARTGFEAVEACKNNPDIDLILMDIKMPGMDGHEATRQIREFNNKVVIIAQTAYGLAGDYEKAIAAGCNDYIAKPIRKDLLLGLLKKYFMN